MLLDLGLSVAVVFDGIPVGIQKVNGVSAPAAGDGDTFILKLFLKLPESCRGRPKAKMVEAARGRGFTFALHEVQKILIAGRA